MRQNIDGFPGLKDLPVLGTLFRSRDFIKRETELVVIVTPYLVKPVARKDLATPARRPGREHGLAGPTSWATSIASTARRGSSPAGDLKGDYGFIVE